MTDFRSHCDVSAIVDGCLKAASRQVGKTEVGEAN